MGPALRLSNINDLARKVEVDNRVPLHKYYRIADNLLKQACIYREEKNLFDLYIILLRFSSLMCDTIPYHRDYKTLHLKERSTFKKKLLDVVDELESLKPAVRRQFDEINRDHMFPSGGQELMSYNSTAAKNQLQSPRIDQMLTRSASQAVRKYNNDRNQVAPSEPLQKERQYQNLSFKVPLPKEETLSRHSILGPNGLQGQWTGPVTGIRVQYPSNADLAQSGVSSLNQGEQYGSIVIDEVDSRKSCNDMEDVLSLDDGRWSDVPVEESYSLANNFPQEDFVQLNVGQPSPPPVLAQVQPEYHVIPPSKVADPRPGQAKPSQYGMPDSKAFQDLHVPVQMMECFLRLAEANTKKNLETCGVLAGSLKNRIFYVTTLIIPKQESTSDSCQTTDEEEIFNVQDKRSLFPLGWIHTHPTQTCFMSSIDLHTHYSYQIMLPEAIAIVMAPTDTSRTHGIFHLSDPSGVSVIRNCQERGFHPHEEPPDGSPIYEHCSHVYMNSNVKFDVVDLRNL